MLERYRHAVHLFCEEVTDSESRRSSSSLAETIAVVVCGTGRDVVAWHCVIYIFLFMFSVFQCVGHAFLYTMILHNMVTA